MTNLLERVVAGSPVGHEERKTDSLEHTGEGTDGDGVKRTLLGGDLGDERWGRAGHEDQAAEVGGALVAKSASGVDEGTNTV